MKQTPLYQQHLSSNAKMVEFAGYQMPIQYADGIKQEHLWVRENAGIFDVSHMGQALLEGEGLADFFAHITPSAFATLENNKAKYTILTNESGGIIDDFIVTKITETLFFIVFNAACKEKDISWIKKHLPSHITFTELSQRALIALQGPKAEACLQSIFPKLSLSEQPYMSLTQASYQGENIFISRLGYTGEDGFEISLPSATAPSLWEALLALPDIKPIGLGARDSLRLEVGYPLYGHDLDDTTSPVEANLSWVIRKKEQSFIGHHRIISELAEHPGRLRVGIKLEEKGILRDGAEIFSPDGKKIGIVTSGSFSPTLNHSAAQGYVSFHYSALSTAVIVSLRGKNLKASIAPLYFVPTRTKK